MRGSGSTGHDRKEVCEPFRTFRKYLVNVPRRLKHYTHDLSYVGIRNIIMKKIAHRINENFPWLLPPDRLGQLFGYQPQVKATLVGVVLHAAEALRKSLCVAMFASLADF